MFGGHVSIADTCGPAICPASGPLFDVVCLQNWPNTLSPVHTTRVIINDDDDKNNTGSV